MYYQVHSSYDIRFSFYGNEVFAMHIGMEKMGRFFFKFCYTITKFMRTRYVVQRRMISLGRCPGRSESLLGTQVILLVLSCTGLFHSVYLKDHYPLTPKVSYLMTWLKKKKKKEAKSVDRYLFDIKPRICDVNI